MLLSRAGVSATERLLFSLLLFNVPVATPSRQQFKTSQFEAIYSNPASKGISDGFRQRRSTSTTKNHPRHSCCVCGVAVYEATFISKWNKTTHPNDFPDKLAHFSSVIGGSHKAEHLLWELGTRASPAVKKFSEWGDTRSLISRIKRHYHGIIKTSEVWYSNKPVTDRFRADKARHFLSILSKITPSPDWFVGIDRLDLCNSTSCMWKRNVTVELRPLDAGTDNGLKFLAPNSKTQPPHPIHRISPNFPDHPAASFFNLRQKSVPPMAEFKVELLHTKGRCPRQTQTPEAINCKVSRWSSWTSCSNPCGRGKKERGRVILVHPKNNGRSCPKLIRSKSCRGRNCTGKADCVVKDWSKWSPCSKTCGRGRRTRRREVAVYPRGGGKGCPNLVHKEKCRRRRCPVLDCKVSNWSEWSVCSKTCGKGKRKRTRMIIQQPTKGGLKCPKLGERQICNAFKCHGKSRLSSISG